MCDLETIGLSSMTLLRFILRVVALGRIINLRLHSMILSQQNEKMRE
jgi:hypothetical protein